MVDSEDITPLVNAAIFSVNAGLMTKDLFFLHCTVEKRSEIMRTVRITRRNEQDGFMKRGICECMQMNVQKYSKSDKNIPLNYSESVYKAYQPGVPFGLPALKIFRLHELPGLDSDQRAIPVFSVLLPLLKGQ